MANIREEVLKRVKPSEADIGRINRVTSELIRKTENVVKKLGVEARAMLVGSVARDTWLRHERDIDIFILFNEELTRDQLERQGLAVAREVAGAAGEERYAEHPYVSMRYRGFDVDLVPCYDLSDPTRLRSSVDRTPHHQRHVKDRLTPQLIDEVLLLKQLAMGTGVYGSELKTRGFSGYLCELLILHYGSFEKLVENADAWGHRKVIDIERNYLDESEPSVLFEGQPLIVIDPVDPNRNVAAAVSTQNFAIFIRACQDFLRKPSLRFFFPRKLKPLDPNGFDKILMRRGTKLFCVKFRPPDLVPDVLYPQLRKTERTLVTRLARSGFEILRSDVWAKGNAVIFLELSVSKLSGVRTRVGPPPTMRAEGFILEHINSDARLAGPFVDEAGRTVFELERERDSAEGLLEEILEERVAFGKHVAGAIAKGYEILEGEGLKKLFRDPDFREFISEYLTRCLPWYR